MGTTSSPDDLEDLRQLIVAPEREAIDALRTRLDDPVARGKDFARALPDAIAQSDDRRLAAALQAPVEHVLTTSVRRNPRPIADALFPIIGPAIRKAIAHALSGMLESLNRTVEHSVSARALQWRLTAWRTGKPFAEIVLLNTLVYRVEQVFLIHTETGLLLEHVTADAVTAQDADMVSGMLTAIRDFARDSFGTGADDTLDTFRVGELAAVIEQGPQAYIAAVVRGTVPPDLRVTLQRALETIHLQQAADFETFKGDATPFADTRPVLQECLEARYQDRKGARRGVPWGWVIAVTIAALAVGAWGVLRWQESRRFAAYRAALEAEPGLVVVESSRHGGRYVLRGLRDPLAADPASFLARSGLSPERISATWQLYQAMDPRFALPRARTVLRPPEGVTLEMTGTVLVASGEAPGAWIRDAMLLARTLPGVSGFDPSRLENAELRSAARRIEAAMLQFEVGTAALVPGQDAALSSMQGELRQLDALARQWGIRYRVVITGHTSADGPEDRNLALSRERAAAVVSVLSRTALPSLELESRGVGSAEPVSNGTGDADKQRNRRVSVRIEPLADGTQP